ncbi:MAG TPA: hypothetical protein PL187_24435, partial [Caldilinea sp.]|nr:hypothetical protein [Caldilinea sp.]
AGQKLRQNSGLTAPEWESGWETIYNAAVGSTAAIDVLNLSAYRMIWIGGTVYPASASTLFLRFSTNNGSSFDAVSGNYKLFNSLQTSAAATPTGFWGDATGITLYSSSISTTYGVHVDIFIDQFNYANICPVKSRMMQLDNSSVWRADQASGWHTVGTARDALRLVAGTGNVSSPRLTILGIRS